MPFGTFGIVNRRIAWHPAVNAAFPYRDFGIDLCGGEGIFQTLVLRLVVAAVLVGAGHPGPTGRAPLIGAGLASGAGGCGPIFVSNGRALVTLDHGSGSKEPGHGAITGCSLEVEDRPGWLGGGLLARAFGCPIGSVMIGFNRRTYGSCHASIMTDTSPITFKGQPFG